MHSVSVLLCIYQQITRGQQNVQCFERLKVDGADWVRRQNFWLFGTATFKDGSRVTDMDAVADAKYFFNTLDRHVLTRKQTLQGERLNRLVFLEHGRQVYYIELKGICDGYRCVKKRTKIL